MASNSVVTRKTDFVECQGSGGPHRVFYTVYTPPNGAPRKQYPVLCVHALTRNQTDFSSLARKLAEHGHEVATVDVVGRGRSDYAKDAKDYNPVSYSKDMATVLDHLGWDKIHWIGTSMGGIIAMIFASQHQRIQGLILNDVGPYVSAEAVKIIGSYLRKQKVFRSLDDVESFLRYNYSGFAPMTEEDWKELARNSVDKISELSEDGAKYMKENESLLWTPEGESKDNVSEATWKLSYDTRVAHIFSQSDDEEPKPIELWEPFSNVQARGLLVLHGSDSKVLQWDTADKMVRQEACPHVKGPRMCVHIEQCGHVPSLKGSFQPHTTLGFLEDVEQYNC